MIDEFNTLEFEGFKNECLIDCESLPELIIRYHVLRHLCKKHGFDIDLISSRARDRWDEMSNRGKHIHIEKAIGMYLVVLSCITPGMCSVCGATWKVIIDE